MNLTKRSDSVKWSCSGQRVQIYLLKLSCNGSVVKADKSDLKF